MPLRDPGDSRREVHNGVVLARHGPVAGRPTRYQNHPLANLLRKLHLLVNDLAAHRVESAALGEGVFGVDIRPVVLDDISNPVCRARRAASATFFIRFGHEDHVAIEPRSTALQQQHRHQAAGDQLLVVHRAASPDVAVDKPGAERILRPALPLHSDHVGMAHDEQRLPRPGALQPRDEAQPIRLRAHQLAGDAFPLQHALEILRGRCLIAGRIAGIDADQFSEVLERFGGDFLPVDLTVQRRRGGEQQKQ